MCATLSFELLGGGSDPESPATTQLASCVEAFLFADETSRRERVKDSERSEGSEAGAARVLYGLAVAELDEAVDFFSTRDEAVDFFLSYEEAEAALGAVLADERSSTGEVRIEPIEFEVSRQ